VPGVRGDDAGIDYRRLRRSASVSALGEGLVAVALPLVAAGLTRDPLAVAAVLAAQHLPWFLAAAFGSRLFGRADRRTTLGAINTVRALALGGLGALVAANAERLWHLLLVAFLVGLGEVLGDDAELAGADSLAAPAGPTEVTGGLGSRAMVLLAVGLVAGGFLFDLLAAVPLVINVAVFSVAALWALGVGRPLRPDPTTSGSALGALTDARPALAPGTGLPTLIGGLASVAGGAVFAVLVLFTLDDLGLGARGFGFLLTAMAAATAAGGLAAPELGRILGTRFGLATSLAVGGGGYVAASVLGAPDAPLPACAALVLAAAATSAAAVLVRVSLHTRPPQQPERPSLRAFQLALGAGAPAGALLGGLAGRALDVGGAIGVAGGLTVVVAVLAAAARPVPETARAGGNAAPTATGPISPSSRRGGRTAPPRELSR
jgi:hypothetical protein